MPLPANRGSIVISQQVRPFAWSNFDPVTRSKVITVESGLGTLVPDIIHPGSSCSIGPGLAAMGVSVPTSATWGLATSYGLFIPFYITVPQTVFKFFAVTGSTAAGNEDIGIYDETLNKIISTGSTAQAAGFHLIDVADTELDTGNHYMGITQDDATSTYFNWALDARLQATIGVRARSADVHPLPSTMTFDAIGTGLATAIPIFGAVVRNA